MGPDQKPSLFYLESTNTSLETYQIKFVGTLHFAPYRAARFSQIFAILIKTKDNDGPISLQGTPIDTIITTKHHTVEINNICRFSHRLRKKSTVVAGFSKETAVNTNMQISSESDIFAIFISNLCNSRKLFLLKIILQGKEMFLT